MRLLTIAIILAYGGLLLFGIGMLPHGEHGVCPFNALSGDCAILGSLGSALNHIEAFQWTLLALPVFFVIFFAATIWNEAASIAPPGLLLARECARAEDVFLPRRRTFRRWLSLVSSYS